MSLSEYSQHEIDLCKRFTARINAGWSTAEQETRLGHLLHDYQQEYGCPAPSIGSPFFMMFSGFVAGLEESEKENLNGQTSLHAKGNSGNLAVDAPDGL